MTTAIASAVQETVNATRQPNTVFLQHNDVFRVSDDMATVTHDLLPGGVYLLEFSILTGYYLKMKPDGAEPRKVYGSANDVADRIINTFHSRPGRTTGVLLGGEKGSGKTMIMTRMSKTLAAQGIPTIIINNNYSGDAFNTFISSIKQPAVLAFDEFEKVYGPKEQEEMLTLLSGVFETHKLVVMTVNDESRINQHMINRPGRLFYRIKYRGVESSAVREYCEDNLNNKEHIDDVVSMAETVFGFNFDMLVSIVEEMNRYKETVAQAVKLMNITYTAFGSDYEVVLMTKNGLSLRASQWYGTLTDEARRVVNFNIGDIKDDAKRNELAMMMQKYSHETDEVHDDRTSSELSWKLKVEEDGSSYIEDLKEAFADGVEVELTKSHWQNFELHLRDAQFIENRGKVCRFETPLGEVVMRRIERKPSPFSLY